LRSIIRRQFKS